MKWPQHVDNSQFCAPANYTFVPQAESIFLSPDAPFAQHDRLDPNRLHGEISIVIRTETPLYTRCAFPPSVDEQEQGNTFDNRALQEHYHHGDPNRPAIAGSSIRGAIRNLVEILSASRLTRRTRPGVGSRVRDTRLVHRAVADQQTPPGRRYASRFREVQAGWLQQKSTDDWQILPATKVDGHSFIRVSRSLIVNFNPEITRANLRPGNLRIWLKPRVFKSGGLYAGEVLTKPSSGYQEATLVPSGEIRGRSKFTAVFPPDDSAAPLPISEDMWNQWLEDRDLTRGLPNREVRRANEPVFYLVEDGQLTFFGPTLTFRIPYQRWTVDYVPTATRLSTDGGPDAAALKGLDLAEALFGTVNEGRRTAETRHAPAGAHRGRVTFDDAVCASNAPFLPGPDGGRRYPSILSSPKPTSYQMYLVQPKSLGSDTRTMKANLLAWDANTPEDGGSTTNVTTLRGFKRYWHRGAPSDEDRAPTSEKDPLFRAGALFRQTPTQHRDQYTRIRPVRAGVEFRGRIRFENLSLVELGALLQALELPATSRHQLGMGKPHGMGSVKITPTVTLYDAMARYSELTQLSVARDDSRLAQAREHFRAAMVKHHNASVNSPKLDESAQIWEIPRLAALKLALEWEGKPKRRDTETQPLARFRDRLPLPSPFAVSGLVAPAVDATVPSVAPSPRSAPAASSKPTPARAPQPTQSKPAETETNGTVLHFSHSGIRLSLEDGTRLTVPVDTRVFPLDEWGALKGTYFPKNKPVCVTRAGTKVIRVVPRKK